MKLTELKKHYIMILAIMFVVVSLSDTTYSLFFKAESTDDIKVNYKAMTLEIEEEKSWLNNTNRKILITILENTILEELDINTGAGKFIIDGIVVRKLDIEQGKGQLQIKNSYAYKADIDGEAGEISIINTTLNNLELDSGVGKVELKSNTTGNSQINCGGGEIDIILLEHQEDYRISLKKE